MRGAGEANRPGNDGDGDGLKRNKKCTKIVKFQILHLCDVFKSMIILMKMYHYYHSYIKQSKEMSCLTYPTAPGLNAFSSGCECGVPILGDCCIVLYGDMFGFP